MNLNNFILLPFLYFSYLLHASEKPLHEKIKIAHVSSKPQVNSSLNSNKILFEKCLENPDIKSYIAEFLFNKATAQKELEKMSHSVQRTYLQNFLNSSTMLQLYTHFSLRNEALIKDFCDSNSNTLLHQAIMPMSKYLPNPAKLKHHNLKKQLIIKHLVRCGCSMHEQNEYGYTPTNYEDVNHQIASKQYNF